MVVGEPLRFEREVGKDEGGADWARERRRVSEKRRGASRTVRKGCGGGRSDVKSLFSESERGAGRCLKREEGSLEIVRYSSRPMRSLRPELRLMSRTIVRFKSFLTPSRSRLGRSHSIEVILLSPLPSVSSSPPRKRRAYNPKQATPPPSQKSALLPIPVTPSNPDRASSPGPG